MKYRPSLNQHEAIISQSQSWVPASSPLRPQTRNLIPFNQLPQGDRDLVGNMSMSLNGGSIERSRGEGDMVMSNNNSTLAHQSYYDNATIRTACTNSPLEWSLPNATVVHSNESFEKFRQQESESDHEGQLQGSEIKGLNIIHHRTNNNDNRPTYQELELMYKQVVDENKQLKEEIRSIKHNVNQSQMNVSQNNQMNNQCHQTANQNISIIQRKDSNNSHATANQLNNHTYANNSQSSNNGNNNTNNNNNNNNNTNSKNSLSRKQIYFRDIFDKSKKIINNLSNNSNLLENNNSKYYTNNSNINNNININKNNNINTNNNNINTNINNNINNNNINNNSNNNINTNNNNNINNNNINNNINNNNNQKVTSTNNLQKNNLNPKIRTNSNMNSNNNVPNTNNNNKATNSNYNNNTNNNNPITYPTIPSINNVSNDQSQIPMLLFNNFFIIGLSPITQIDSNQPIQTNSRRRAPKILFNYPNNQPNIAQLFMEMYYNPSNDNSHCGVGIVGANRSNHTIDPNQKHGLGLSPFKGGQPSRRGISPFKKEQVSLEEGGQTSNHMASQKGNLTANKQVNSRKSAFNTQQSPYQGKASHSPLKINPTEQSNPTFFKDYFVITINRDDNTFRKSYITVYEVNTKAVNNPNQQSLEEWQYICFVTNWPIFKSFQVLSQQIVSSLCYRLVGQLSQTIEKLALNVIKENQHNIVSIPPSIKINIFFPNKSENYKLIETWKTWNVIAMPIFVEQATLRLGSNYFDFNSQTTPKDSNYAVGDDSQMDRHLQSLSSDRTATDQKPYREPMESIVQKGIKTELFGLLISCLISQIKVVLYSTSKSKLSQAILYALELIKPLEYVNPVMMLTSLKGQCQEYLSAPMPLLLALWSEPKRNQQSKHKLDLLLHKKQDLLGLLEKAQLKVVQGVIFNLDTGFVYGEGLKQNMLDNALLFNKFFTKHRDDAKELFKLFERMLTSPNKKAQYLFLWNSIQPLIRQTQLYNYYVQKQESL